MKFIRTKSNLTKEQVNALDFDWGYIHMLTDQPMTFDEVLGEIAAYNEIYTEDEGQFNPDPYHVAYSLIRTCEVGMAQVV